MLVSRILAGQTRNRANRGLSERRYLIVGGVLMILLGLVRGTGGVVLLAGGSAVDPNIVASGPSISVVAVILLLIGVVLVIAAVGVLCRLRTFWLIGTVCTVAFVIDGAINGYVLYGRPGAGGTVVNLIAAVFILGCLFAGKRALRDEG